MKHFFLLWVLNLSVFSVLAQTPSPEDYFITTWKPDGSWQPITIPTYPGLTYNYSVDWGDGTITTGHTGSASHSFNDTNLHTIKIYGVFPRFYNTQYNTNLRSVEQWGNIEWTSMEDAFKSCQNLVIKATDNPNLSQVTSMKNMFYQASDFTGDISGWDVRNVKDFSYMFYQCRRFNQDIGNWDMRSATNISFMFFENDVFNQDIGNWNTSNVTNMASIFSGALKFNQNLGRWNMSKVANITDMFERVKLSTANYDAILKGWSSQALVPGLILNAYNASWCTAGAERTLLLTKWLAIWNDSQNCNGGHSFCDGGITEYNGTWSNGQPTATKKVIFKSNYNTTAANIEACIIQINEGVTVTVAPNTFIKANQDLVIYGKLIFESTATGDGELGSFGERGAVVGKAEIHRYMSPHRAYRMVGSAVNTTNSIMENWQEGVHNTATPYSSNLNPKPGYGTHITGSQTGLNGFDATQTGNPSMYSVNSATQQFEIVGNTDQTKLNAGDAYLLLVRGDRSIDLNNNNSSPTPTILRTDGKLTWGKKHLKYVVPNSGSFVMFGNPYQSAVDMSTVLATSENVNRNHYYVYDPTIGEYGAYVTVNLTNGTKVPLTSAANKYLQPGQGAQIQSINKGLVTLDFLESDKKTGNPTATNATGDNPVPDASIFGELYTLQNYNNNGPLHDAFGIVFSSNFNNALTSTDAIKPMNFYENLGVESNGVYLSLEERNLPEAGEVFPLFTTGYSQENYVLEIKTADLENYLIYLEDNFTGESKLLAQHTTTHTFTVHASQPESKATDRFSLRIAERLSIQDNEQNLGITFFPNPLNSELNIHNGLQVEIETLKIYDLMGRLIKSYSMTTTERDLTFDVSTLPAATYMVTVESKAGKTHSLMIKL